MGGEGQQRLNRRPGVILLALAALWIQALIPAGYMAAPDHSGLVICTGHGPLTSHNQPGGAPASSHEAACVFAGHGLALATPVFDRLPAPVVVAYAAPTRISIEQTPGRGLAAPPPLPTGPPELI